MDDKSRPYDWHLIAIGIPDRLAVSFASFSKSPLAGGVLIDALSKKPGRLERPLDHEERSLRNAIAARIPPFFFPRSYGMHIRISGSPRGVKRAAR